MTIGFISKQEKNLMRYANFGEVSEKERESIIASYARKLSRGEIYGYRVFG